MHKTLGVIIGMLLLVLAIWFGLRLYDITSQPALKLEDNAYIVVNCAQPRNQHANMVCPYLYCNKSLLESGDIPKNASIMRSSAEVTQTNRIVGKIHYINKENTPVEMAFQCRMQADTVLGYDIFTPK